MLKERSTYFERPQFMSKSRSIEQVYECLSFAILEGVEEDD